MLKVWCHNDPAEEKFFLCSICIQKEEKVSLVEKTVLFISLQMCGDELPYSFLCSSRCFPTQPILDDMSGEHWIFSVEPKEFYQWVIRLTVLVKRYKSRISLKKIIQTFWRSLSFAWFFTNGIAKCNSRMKTNLNWILQQDYI